MIDLYSWARPNKISLRLEHTHDQMTPTLQRIPLLSQRLLQASSVLVFAGLLAACASKPSADISLIPTQTDAVTSQDGLFVQPVKWSRTKKGCKGDCPKMSVDSLVFPGVPKLTELVDHALAMMTGTGDERLPPYSTIAEFETYFWKTAGSRDVVMLAAKTRYRNRYLTVIELNSGQYFTGAAHGLTATQFLNWDNTAGSVLGMDQILVAGAYPRFVQALERAHARWKANNPDVQDDPATWQRLWPFQATNNIALTDTGVVAKYDSYEIAPYSSGQPELHIPYTELAGILRPEYLPRSDS